MTGLPGSRHSSGAIAPPGCVVRSASTSRSFRTSRSSSRTASPRSGSRSSRRDQMPERAGARQRSRGAGGAAATRPLPHRTRARPGRPGRRLPRGGRGPPPQGRAEGDRARGLALGRSHRPLPQGSRVRRAHRPPGDVQRLQGRRARRSGVPRDAVRRGRDARERRSRAKRDRRAAGPEATRHERDEMLRVVESAARARARCAREGRRASRHQAREHHDRLDGGAVSPRLRARARGRSRGAVADRRARTRSGPRRTWRPSRSDRERKAGSPADVYALGAVLYEMLLLRRAFEAPTRELLYRAILLEEPSGLGRGSGTLPADVRMVLATALEKDRDRRYRTALDFAEDLARLRAGQPLRARPPGAWRRFVLWQATASDGGRAAGVRGARHRCVLRTPAPVDRASSGRAATTSGECAPERKGCGSPPKASSRPSATRRSRWRSPSRPSARARDRSARTRSTARCSRTASGSRSSAHDDQVTACALTPDDRTAITGDSSGLWLAGTSRPAVSGAPGGPLGRPVFAPCSPGRIDGLLRARARQPLAVALVGAGPPVPIESQKAARTCAFDASGDRLSSPPGARDGPPGT